MTKVPKLGAGTTTTSDPFLARPTRETAFIRDEIERMRGQVSRQRVGESYTSSGRAYRRADGLIQHMLNNIDILGAERDSFKKASRVIKGQAIASWRR